MDVIVGEIVGPHGDGRMISCVEVDNDVHIAVGGKVDQGSVVPDSPLRQTVTPLMVTSMASGS